MKIGTLILMLQAGLFGFVTSLESMTISEPIFWVLVATNSFLMVIYGNVE